MFEKKITWNVLFLFLIIFFIKLFLIIKKYWEMTTLSPVGDLEDIK